MADAPVKLAGGENPHAAKLEAILHLFLAARTEEELAEARRLSALIARMTPEEVQAVAAGAGGDNGEGPLHFARAEREPGDPLPDQPGHAPATPQVPEGATINGLPGGSFVNAGCLAAFYADLFNDLADANCLSDEQVSEARDELESFSWDVRLDGGVWHPLQLSDPQEAEEAKQGQEWEE